MKQNRTLSAAVALTLSACPLFAQDNQPPRPPQTPPSEGGPQRQGGPQREGARGGNSQRPMGGLFATLDANRDGAIDKEELNHAADFLNKLDRNGDGRITPDEIRSPGEKHRPQAGGEGGKPREGGPQARDGEGRGDMQRPEGMRRDGGQSEHSRGDGDRGPHGGSDGRHEGAGPKRDGGPSPSRGEGGPRREGPQGPPPQEQARHQGEPNAGQFAQREPRPDFGRNRRTAPWTGGMRRDDAAPRGPFAMGPRMDVRRGRGLPPMRDGGPGRELRNDMGSRGPQGAPGDFRPPMPAGRGPDRQSPPRMERPDRKPMPSGSHGSPEMRRPEGARDGIAVPQPRGERDGRSEGPWRRDVQ